MNTRKIYSLLGLAQRARKLESGAFLTEKCVKSGKAALVILSSDASDRTGKDIRNLCAHYETELLELGTKAQLGQCLGQEERSCCALKDIHMAEEILRLSRQDEA